MAAKEEACLWSERVRTDLSGVLTNEDDKSRLTSKYSVNSMRIRKESKPPAVPPDVCCARGTAREREL